MGNVAIWKGKLAKILAQNGIELMSGACISDLGTIDPSATGFAAPVGSVGLSTTGAWNKFGALDTNWTPLSAPVIVWGYITGTLSDQADLQAELDLKANVADIGQPFGIAPLDGNSQVPLANIAPQAVERMVIVADQAARFALTTATAQDGDTVLQNDTGEMWFVVDDTNLGNASGYQVYKAGTASQVPFSGVTGKPTTLAGYGITDAALESDLLAHTGNTSNPHSVTAAQAGAVPTARTVNGHALSADVTVAAADVPLTKIGTPTYSTLQDMQNLFHSAGWVSGGGVTDNGNGTVNVAAGTGAIRTGATSTSPIAFFDWVANAALSLTDNANNYVYVTYNAGAPIIATSTSSPADALQNIMLALVYRAGTFLQINTTVKQTVGDHAALMVLYNQEVMPYSHASGAILGATGTRNISVTAGAFWEGLTRFTTSAFDSSAAGRFTYIRRNGSGGWTETATQSQINNTQYDDGSGTLATLTNTRYAIGWVYLETDSDIVVLYGQGDYTLAQAQAAAEPATLPPRLIAHGFLIGRVILQKSASSFTQVDTVFATTFATSGVTNHNDTANIQDAPNAVAGEHYHLNSAQATSVSGATDVNTGSTIVKRTALGKFNIGTIVFEAVTANRVPYVDGTNNLVESSVTPTELGYLSGVTSAIQTQLNALSTVVRAVSTSQTLLTTDGTLIASGTITLTLPPSSGLSGKVYRIKKTDSSATTVTLDGNASETIDGSLTLAINTQYEAIEIVTDGSNWYVI